MLTSWLTRYKVAKTVLASKEFGEFNQYWMKVCNGKKNYKTFKNDFKNIHSRSEKKTIEHEQCSCSMDAQDVQPSTSSAIAAPIAGKYIVVIILLFLLIHLKIFF